MTKPESTLRHSEKLCIHLHKWQHTVCKTVYLHARKYQGKKNGNGNQLIDLVVLCLLKHV